MNSPVEKQIPVKIRRDVGCLKSRVLNNDFAVNQYCLKQITAIPTAAKPVKTGIAIAKVNLRHPVSVSIGFDKIYLRTIKRKRCSESGSSFVSNLTPFFSSSPRRALPPKNSRLQSLHHFNIFGSFCVSLSSARHRT